MIFEHISKNFATHLHHKQYYTDHQPWYAIDLWPMEEKVKYFNISGEKIEGKIKWPTTKCIPENFWYSLWGSGDKQAHIDRWRILTITISQQWYHAFQNDEDVLAPPPTMIPNFFLQLHQFPLGCLPTYSNQSNHQQSSATQTQKDWRGREQKARFPPWTTLI